MTARPLPLDPATPDDDLTSASGTARDSMTVGLWTSVSRATGVVRVIVIGAVLGPTFFGNVYQLTNYLPNLIFYGFLAGSLLISLLVPALVRYIDTGRPEETARISGGFLGVSWIALLAAAPLAVLAVPLLLRAVSVGESAGLEAEQIAQARLLLVLALPQIFLYAVIASATAVSYAHRRYTLAAAAPALENIGVIAVLGLVALVYGVEHDGAIPTGELVLLGLGSTAAVALHASVQWWGAHRFGVSLRPRNGWRDPEVRTVIRRASRSLMQAGLLAVQVLVLLVVSSRVAGGTVAMQIALNFYHLPLALAAAPVALALLPRLARLQDREQRGSFAEAYTRAIALAVFLVTPAAFGYIVLSEALAHSVAAGQMNTAAGVALVAGSLAAISLGLVGETFFVVSTQAAYSRGDAGMPLRSMSLQAVVCLALAVPAFLVDDERIVTVLGAAYAAAALTGGLHLYARVRRSCGPTPQRLWPSLLRVAVAVAVMVPVVYVAAELATSLVDGRPGWVLAVVVGSLAGAVTYGLVHLLLRSAELGWLLDGVRHKSAVPLPESEAT